MAQPRVNNDTDTSADTAAIEAILRDVYKAMLAADTAALGAMLAGGFTLTHITGVVQPRAEWLADIDKRRMAYHSAQEVSVTARLHGDAATAVARPVVDATIYGGRGNSRPTSCGAASAGLTMRMVAMMFR